VSIFSRALRVYQEGRLREAFGAAFKRIRDVVYRRDDVVIYHYGRESAPPPRPQEPLAFGGFADLETFAARHPDLYDDAQMQFARQRYAAGHRIYALRIDGEVAQVSWLRVANEIAPTEVAPKGRIVLEEVTGIIYDCWTPPRFRGRGLYPRVLGAIVSDAHANGMDVWMYCYCDNTGSIRGIEKAGFRKHSHMWRVRVLGVLNFGGTVRV
jgi:RimJ/RimL family protein N-acetyltransferase